MSKSFKLIENGSATSDAVRWQGGHGTFVVTATWNSATITLQYQSSDSSTWVDVGTEAALKADGMCGFTCGPGLLRAEVDGSPSAVYAHISGNASG